MRRVLVRLAFVLALAGAGGGCYRAHGPLGDGPGFDAPLMGLDAALPVLDAPLPFDGGPPDVPARDAAGLCSVTGCPPSPIFCAANVCRAEVCQLEPIPGACGPGGRCDLALGGCVADFDAGRDAGFDAGRDAGRDAPALDAPRDAPRLDAPRDAPRLDAPRDAPRLDAPRDAPRDVPPDVPIDVGRPPTSRAMRCDPGEHMTVNHRNPLDLTPELTLELWVRARTPGQISGKGDPSGRENYRLEIVQSADGRLELVGGFSTAAGRNEVRGPFDGHMGVWTHVALRQAAAAGGVRLDLLINAMVVASATFVDTTGDSFNSLPLVFCGGGLDGDLDEIRLWSHPRDVSLIASQLFMQIPTNSGGLVAYWPLEFPTQIQQDRTLHGNDGFLGDGSAVDLADPSFIPDGAF